MSDREFTLEELSYFRICYIAANIIRDGLQAVLKQEWDRVHGWRLGPWQDTEQNGKDFVNIKSPKSQNKNKRFLSIIENGNTSEWECTCFFFAILFSDSLEPLVSPPVAVNVDALRVFRNGIFARLSQASILDTDFQANVKLVSNAFIALRLSTKEVQEVLQAKPKSFACLPARPSHEVTERKSDVDDVIQMFMDLQSTNEGGSIVTVYVSVNAGCDKSQFARDVVRKLYEKQ